MVKGKSSTKVHNRKREALVAASDGAAEMKKDLTISQRPRRRVAVLMDFSRAYGRKLLAGIAKFLQEHYEWSVESEEWRWTDEIPEWFRHWDGDGVIAWVETPELAEVICRLRVPAVDVRGSLSSEYGLALVDAENETVVRLAADHLIQRGIRHFAFCGFPGASYSDKRSRLFRDYLSQVGFACAIYTPPKAPEPAANIEYEKQGLLFQSHFVAWLKSLPKPVGLMACNDICGQQMINVCRRNGLVVPEEVAIIGVDNDEVLCELSNPPLSSVMLDTMRTGYETAAMLERMMAGDQPPSQALLVPPLGIVTRRSTDTLATDDKRLAAGVRFLREHVFDGVTVSSMAREAGMCRTKFERRFAALVGHSPKAEVLRLRLEKVKELLTHTDWTLDLIADRTGFKSAQYLHTVFSKKVGSTPGTFRGQAKLEHE
jgi:LacI family transcriptional regulator